MTVVLTASDEKEMAFALAHVWPDTEARLQIVDQNVKLGKIQFT